MKRRPISILILSILFIAVGLGGLIVGGWTLLLPTSSDALTPHGATDASLKLVSGALAVTSGVFMLRAANWARWLCLVWLALHVLLSYFHAWSELLAHALLLVIAIYILFRPAVTKYFSSQTNLPQQVRTPSPQSR